MSTYVWIAVVIVFYSIIKGIWKVLNKRSEDAMQVPNEADLEETVEAESTPWWEENVEEEVEQAQEEVRETTAKPVAHEERVAAVRSVKNDLQEEEDDDDDDLDVDIDLSDPDDVTKAFIASEIFNKKY